MSRRLGDELGAAATGAAWPELGTLPKNGDWVLTPELFSENERPGITAFLERRPCRLAAIYHDAIPLKHPAITWPRSVERHAAYMKLLSRFDRVWAVSAASRDELLGFWGWQGIQSPPPVDVLHLGADWPGVGRSAGGEPARSGPPRIVSIGILEPRKNQEILLDAFESLMAEGTELELHLVGRVNPHFGKPIERRVGELRRRWRCLTHHAGMDDASLAALVRSARATAFPSIAEGCGLPLLESLWMGVPCLCSDIAPLVENAAAGGCSIIEANSAAKWTGGLRRIIADEGFHARLVSEASSRELPTWAGAAKVLRDALV